MLGHKQITQALFPNRKHDEHLERASTRLSALPSVPSKHQRTDKNTPAQTLHSPFADIDPALLFDTLYRYLLPHCAPLIQCIASAKTRNLEQGQRQLVRNI